MHVRSGSQGGDLVFQFTHRASSTAGSGGLSSGEPVPVADGYPDGTSAAYTRLTRAQSFEIHSMALLCSLLRQDKCEIDT